MPDAPSLEQLIALAKDEADSDDPIDELAAAAGLKSELDELTDAVLGHFVDQARRAGRSWTQIGEALGVTKQAAQQRHATAESTARRLLARLVPASWPTGKGFLARFTTRAKAAVAAADAEARALGHGYIGTEHLLLGLFVDPDAIAPKVLLEHGIDRTSVEDVVVELIGRGEDAPAAGHLPFTPRAKTALEHALRQALELGHNYIGTEHVLLGVLAEGDGVGARILLERDLGLDTARGDVIRHLSGLRPGA